MAKKLCHFRMKLLELLNIFKMAQLWEKFSSSYILPCFGFVSFSLSASVNGQLMEGQDDDSQCQEELAHPEDDAGGGPAYTLL